MIFNVLPGSVDERDYVLQAGHSIPPESYFIPTKYLRPVKNQGKEGACSAYAVATVKEIQERMEIGFKATFSPEFVYRLRSMKPRAGMTPRETFTILQKIGIIPEHYWKRKYNKDGVDIPQNVLEVAQNFKISGYARAYDIDAVKSSIVSHGGCYLALPVYNPSRKDFWLMQDDDPLLGGHAVAVIGYDRNGFLIRNSWGTEWGIDGHTVLPFSDWGSVWEAWFILDDKTVAKFKRSGKIIQ